MSNFSYNFNFVYFSMSQALQSYISIDSINSELKIQTDSINSNLLAMSCRVNLLFQIFNLFRHINSTTLMKQARIISPSVHSFDSVAINCNSFYRNRIIDSLVLVESFVFKVST